MGKFRIFSSSSSRLWLHLVTSSFQGIGGSAQSFSASQGGSALLSEVLRILSFQSSKCCSSSGIEGAPARGRFVATSGEIRANNSASEGPYQAPFTVAAR